MNLSIKGKDIFLRVVENKGCECKKCICKFQFNCLKCDCCLRKHLIKMYHNPEIIRTEITIE